MDGMTLALLGFLGLFILLFIRVPAGIALTCVGFIGIYFIRPSASLPILANEIFSEASNYSLIIIPLFILMGHLASVSGMSKDLYNAANHFLGHFRGGLASSTVLGCAGFSALSGSSLATALAMGHVSIPQMRNLNYDDRLATGAVAAGGTLGILIPPSGALVIYSLLTEESIARLFVAGILPGILLAILFIATIWIIVVRNPEKAPTNTDAKPFLLRLIALRQASALFLIIFITIGGIYGGIFSTIEASAIGAFLSLLVTVSRGKLTWENIQYVLRETLKSTGAIFLVLCGAFVFKSFIGYSSIALSLSQWVVDHGFTGTEAILLILGAVIILGMLMDGYAIMVLTIPVIQPILEINGIDLIWFGVLFILVIEIGLITPPVGINIFVVKSIAPDIPMPTIIKGIWPFWIAMIVAIILILIFPQITNFLPTTMFTPN